jgi:gliding motility-associated-like protein
MRLTKLLIVILFLGVMLTAAQNVGAQTCSVAGQNPETAFPVCGTTTFAQRSVPVCDNGPVPSPSCDPNGIPYSALNPYWYKFTCFSAGTLGLLIQPNDPEDDYDWEIFDVTNQPLSAVFTDAKLVIASNWSGRHGNTGTSATATSLFECGSNPNANPPTNPPIFSKMPTLVLGHQYLLMISHFSGSDQSGYALSFGGGTASITDPTPPAVKSATAICDGSRIEIVLNKPMRCSSLASNGSDFVLSPVPPGVKVINAFPINCSGFDLDTLVVFVNSPLTPGSYKLTMATGTDANTLVDICGAEVPVGQEVPFDVKALQNLTIDSIAPVGCAPDLLRLVFPKKIDCSSIAADGSDFTVTGTAPVSVTGAYGQCDTSNKSYSVFIKLAAPILRGGNYTIHLGLGSDFNTLIDECGLLVLPSSLAFTTGDTVSAALLTDQVKPGCTTDTIVYDYPSVDGVTQWTWVFDGKDTSRIQHPPPEYYTVFDTKHAQLIVSNGFCTDTANIAVPLTNAIDAALEAPNIICPRDEANYLNKSIGILSSFTWDLGDGTTFIGETPSPHLYPPTGVESKYTVTLIVGNAIGCYDTAAQQIDVLRSCYIAVPGAFTPNGDGLNDYLYPLNAYKADHLDFKVYNRFGQVVFETHDWTQKWDGTVNGHKEPSGGYVWMLSYTDRDTGKRVFQKGTTILIR